MQRALRRATQAAILDEVRDSVKWWPQFAARAKLSGDVSEKIQRAHRLDLEK